MIASLHNIGTFKNCFWNELKHRASVTNIQGSGRSVTSERLFTWSRQPAKASRRRLTCSLPAADGRWSAQTSELRGVKKKALFDRSSLTALLVFVWKQRRLRPLKYCLISRAGKEELCDITHAAGIPVTRQVEQYWTIKKAPHFKIVLSVFRDWKTVFFSFLSWCVPPVPRCPSQSLLFISLAPGTALAGLWFPGALVASSPDFEWLIPNRCPTLTFFIQILFSSQILRSHLLVSIVDPLILGWSSIPQLHTARPLSRLSIPIENLPRSGNCLLYSVICQLHGGWKRLARLGPLYKPTSKQATLLDSFPSIHSVSCRHCFRA